MEYFYTNEISTQNNLRGPKSERDLNSDSFFTAGASEVNLQFSYPKFIYILSDALLWQNLPH